MDMPPLKWFKEPLTEGLLKGAMLDSLEYDAMLKNVLREERLGRERNT
jgi:hypothetical protein